MSCRYYKNYVRITHIPTGVVVEANTRRTIQGNREAALGMLKSKLFMLGYEYKEKEVAYDLPDDNLWPNELGEYRNKIGKLTGNE